MSDGAGPETGRTKDCKGSGLSHAARRLTLCMLWLLVIMESVGVMTGNVIQKDTTRFWRKLFCINAALSVTTGTTRECRFGTSATSPAVDGLLPAHLSVSSPPTLGLMQGAKPSLHGKEPTMNPTLSLDDAGTGPSVQATPHDPEKRLWLIATGVAGGTAAVATAIPFVATFEPSERAKAAGGPVEVDLSDIPPGGNKTVEWRGKPVWIFRRTPAMLAALQGHDDELVDPQSKKDQQPAYARNAARALKPEVFVAVGICTHLGCSPSTAPAGVANPSLPADWPGGFLCPCHGSTFDGAGRVFKNKPAPTNLEVPPYRYASDSRIVLGEDTAPAA